MKFINFVSIIAILLVIITLSLSFIPLFEVQMKLDNTNNNLTSGSSSFSYVVTAIGPISFYTDTSMSRELNNLQFDYSYINVTMSGDTAIFSVSIYAAPAGSPVDMVKHFILNASSSSPLFGSFFTGRILSVGQYDNVFNVTGHVISRTTSTYNKINYGTFSADSIAYRLALLGIKQQPSGYWGNESKDASANNAYYVNSQSHAFLSNVLLSGNSSVVAALFENTGVSNTTLLNIHLHSTNVRISTLNTQYYLTKYLLISPLIWIFGIVFVISTYRQARKRHQRK